MLMEVKTMSFLTGQEVSERPGKSGIQAGGLMCFSYITVGLYCKAMKMHREIKPQINAKLYHLMDQSKNVFRDQT